MQINVPQFQKSCVFDLTRLIKRKLKRLHNKFYHPFHAKTDANSVELVSAFVKKVLEEGKERGLCKNNKKGKIADQWKIFIIDNQNHFKYNTESDHRFSQYEIQR